MASAADRQRQAAGFARTAAAAAAKRAADKKRQAAGHARTAAAQASDPGAPINPATGRPYPRNNPGGTGWVNNAPAGYAPTGPGAPAPVAPIPTVKPNFDFAVNASPGAQGEIADLLQGFKEQTGGSVDAAGNFVPGETAGTIGAEHGNLRKTLEARRPIIEQTQRKGLQDMASSMAGRGLIRSGLKEEGDLGVNTQAMTDRNEVERGIQDSTATEATARSNAAARLILGRNRITTGAAADYATERAADPEGTHGGAPDPPPAAATAPPPTKPPTLAQFFKSHPGGDKKKLKAAYIKRFG